MEEKLRSTEDGGIGNNKIPSSSTTFEEWVVPKSPDRSQVSSMHHWHITYMPKDDKGICIAMNNKEQILNFWGNKSFIFFG